MDITMTANVASKDWVEGVGFVMVPTESTVCVG